MNHLTSSGFNSTNLPTQPQQEEVWNAAIRIVDEERRNWEEAVVFVTDSVAFRMRQLIRTCRKNYWGIFDEPIDPQTNREKVWFGLIMSHVETWLKNIDLDQKDISFIARNPKGLAITELTRLIVRDSLDKMYFGEILDTVERQVLIDGTAVWKTWEQKGSKKMVVKRRTVDLLNCYIDPAENSIQEAYRFTERAVLLPEQIESMSGWYNTKDLVGSQVLNKTDGRPQSTLATPTTGKFRDVWETWGKIPKWLTTGDKNAKDAYDEIDGHIVISGLESGKSKCHLVEENKRKDKYGNAIKPYEEWRCAKISGRWYGLGIAERLLALQEYLNATLNIRLNRGYVSQLGLFKIRKGAGITAQMLSRLPMNGAITVNNPDDITQMSVSEVGASSYRDEDTIKYWAQQMSGAQPVSNGDILPSGATATSAAISSTAAQSAYIMFKEGTGHFLERWIDRQYLPLFVKTIDKSQLVRLVQDDEKFKELVANIAMHNVEMEVENGKVIPTKQEALDAVAKEEERLLKSPALFIENTKDIIPELLDTKVQITNEDQDSSVTIANLLQMLQVAPEYKEGIVRQVFDIMGLSVPKEMNNQAALPVQTGQAPEGIPSNMVDMMQQSGQPQTPVV